MTDEAPPPVWTPRFNPWLIGMVVALAAFMEVLDTSIANVALPHVAGSLAASNSESTWVLTSYLVSNAIVLPLSGWLANAFGRKRFFILCIAGFTVSSMMCGFAPSLNWLIFARVLQGLAGGGLQPLAQAILADTFPPAKRGMAFAMYGVTVVVAPTVGPILGGWITDNYSWRWIFFINGPVGVATIALVRRLVEDPPYLVEKARTAFAGIKIDYVGLALLTLGIGALQVLLDRGQEDDWLGSHFIVTLMVISAISLTALVIWEWFQETPVIDVQMFRNANFAAANLMMFFVGVVYFASLVMMPLFLQSLLGYTAQIAGEVLSLGGLVTLVTLPLVGQLTSRVRARALVAFGWLLMCVAMAVTAVKIDLLISYEAAERLRLAQSLGLGFLFIPINLVAYIGLPPEKSGSVSGLINFSRNIGSSVGTSMVSTLLDRRAQVHQVFLGAHATRFSTLFSARQAALSDRLGGDLKGYGALYVALQREAQALAYIDTFWLLAAAAGIMLGLSFLLKKNDPRSGGSVVVE